MSLINCSVLQLGVQKMCLAWHSDLYFPRLTKAVFEKRQISMPERKVQNADEFMQAPSKQYGIILKLNEREGLILVEKEQPLIIELPESHASSDPEAVALLERERHSRRMPKDADKLGPGQDFQPSIECKECAWVLKSPDPLVSKP